MALQLIPSTVPLPERRGDLSIESIDAKGNPINVGYWGAQHQALAVFERATPEDLAEILRSELAGKARKFQIAFSKKAKITDLPDLSSLAVVERLTIWRVNVGTALCSVPTARELDLYDVGAIPPFGRPMSVRLLNVGGGKTTSLPEDIEQAEHLESIELRDIGIKALPEGIGALRSLHTLDVVGATRVRKLPKTGAFVALKKLILQDFGPDAGLPEPAWLEPLRGRLETRSTPDWK